MKSSWFIRPILRLGAASALPFVVPAVITAVVWALPGDPSEIVCPRAVCGGTAALSARWHLDQGPWAFYRHWMAAAWAGDFGRSWRVVQGMPVRQLLDDAIPVTSTLVAVGATLVLGASALGVTGAVARRATAAATAIGVAPAVLLALVASASVELRYGAGAFDAEAARWRVLAGALVLAFADGALGSAVAGVRATLAAERAHRYVAHAELRGEDPLANMLPNVAPALAGQVRARLLQLLSGSVVVEVVLRLDGVGDLLWRGALRQDFGVVLAAATFFATGSAALLAAQAIVELGVGWSVRRAPLVAAAGVAA